MSPAYTVERWCPKCEKHFESTVTIEPTGKECTRIESPCPKCGGAGETFLQIPRS